MRNGIVTEGYKLNGYDATYEKTTFSVRKRYEDRHKVINEVTELNSGITFIYEVKKNERNRKKHNRQTY